MEPFCFKHWSNKKYAILNSLHRVIRIGTLSFVYTLLQTQPVLAQNDTASPVLHYDLEEVESIGENEIDIYSPSLRIISTIIRQEIITSPAPSLAQLLDYFPLTDVRTRGYHGVQSDLNIQGGSFDQSIILLNGINISDPQTGHFNLDIPISHSQLNQVEILAGPATKTYGINAYSGAVNLITTPSDSMRIDAELKAGQFNFYHAASSLHLPAGPMKTMVSISSSSSDGYTGNTDFDQSGVYLHSNLNLKRIEANLMAGINQKDFGANSFYTPRFPEQYEQTEMQFVGFTLSTLALNPRIESRVYWRRHRDHFLLFRSDPSFYENFHESDLFGGEVNLLISTKFGVTKTGITLRSEQIVSSSLGDALAIPEPVLNSDSAFYNYGFSRMIPGVFLNHNFVLGRFRSSAGALAYYSATTGNLSFYPGIDLSYQVNPDLNLIAGVNRSMRLPTFTDLFYRGPQNVGNPSLVPETAVTFESGLQYSNTGFSGNISLFYRIGKQTIDWIWQADEKWHTENLTELNTYGGEISLILYPSSIYKNFKIIEHFRTSYSYTEINKASDEFISNYALDNLKHKWVIDLGIRLPLNFSVNYILRMNDRNGSYLSYDTETGISSELPYMSYTLNDVSVRYRLRQLTIFVDISNILNVDYRDIGSISQPGRWIIGGIEISVGGK